MTQGYTTGKRMADHNAIHNPVIELIAPALAGGGGAMVGSAFGPARTFRQHLSEVGAMILATVLFGPWFCDAVGIEAANSRGAAAVYATLGLFGPLALRAILSIADETARQAEDGKSDTARRILRLVKWQWLRQPDLPPVPGPTVIVVDPPTPVPAGQGGQTTTTTTTTNN